MNRNTPNSIGANPCPGMAGIAWMFDRFPTKRQNGRLPQCLTGKDYHFRLINTTLGSTEHNSKRTVSSGCVARWTRQGLGKDDTHYWPLVDVVAFRHAHAAISATHSRPPLTAHSCHPHWTSPRSARFNANVMVPEVTAKASSSYRAPVRVLRQA